MSSAGDQGENPSSNLFGMVAHCPLKNYEEWAQYPGQELVAKLDDQNTKSWIAAQKSCIVFIYAKTCMYNETYKPVIAETATQLKAGGSKCTVGTIDGTTFRDFVKGEIGVHEAPTFNIYKDGQLYGEYKYQRDPSCIIRYLKKECIY